MHTVTVPWKNQQDLWWNETCAMVMDRFGLPGGLYRTEISTECMKFIFNDERNALMCQLLVSERL